MKTVKISKWVAWTKCPSIDKKTNLMCQLDGGHKGFHKCEMIWIEEILIEEET